MDDEKCTIILYENPPYSDSSAITFTEDGDLSKRAKTNKKGKYVAEEFKSICLSTLKEQRGSARESSNLFIWSGLHYYLRQPTDSIIVFSPVKYFKSIGLVKLKFVDGYAFNRKYFHATDSVISCCLWANETDDITSSWILHCYDIIDDSVSFIKDIMIKEVSKNISSYNDLRKDNKDIETTVVCQSNGYPLNGYTYTSGRKPLYNDNIIGYIETINYAIDAKNVLLVRTNLKKGLEQSFGYHLRKDNYLHKITIWCAKMYSQDEWYDRDIYYSCADGGDTYTHDENFLKSCLIYTCLSNQNKCLSFTGSDGRYYRNELCFDTTNGDTVASVDLARMSLDEEEKELLKLWKDILEEAKKTKEYQKELTYGVYQITKLNTSRKIGSGKSKKTVYDYPILNGYLEALRINLKKYYKSHITEKMFEYELLK